MTDRLRRRLSTLERRSDPFAVWRGVPASECPDWVLIALIDECLGWPPGYQPTDGGLAALVREGSRA